MRVFFPDVRGTEKRTLTATRYTSLNPVFEGLMTRYVRARLSEMIHLSPRRGTTGHCSARPVLSLQGFCVCSGLMMR